MFYKLLVCYYQCLSFAVRMLGYTFVVKVTFLRHIRTQNALNCGFYTDLWQIVQCFGHLVKGLKFLLPKKHICKNSLTNQFISKPIFYLHGV